MKWVMGKRKLQIGDKILQVKAKTVKKIRSNLWFVGKILPLENIVFTVLTGRTL